MRKLAFSSRGFWSRLGRFCESAQVPDEIRETVSSVLTDVKSRGDAAVSDFTEKFDGVRLTPKDFQITTEAMAAAARRLAPRHRSAIREAIRCVGDFNKHSLPKNWTARNPHGAKIGETFYPLERVGVYIPKGLVSTVVMTTVLARIARVPEIVVFTPCGREGSVSDGVLAALHLCGIQEAYRIGGVQAVGAMAYGTQSIRSVVKIFGPGNAYVVEGKRQVFGQIGVDLLPGPSEVMVIADESANPAFVAADLLAQAEHGSGREKIYLVATSTSVIEAIDAEIRSQIGSLPRQAVIRKVLKDGFLAVVVANLSEAAEVANFVAPEHLELEVEPAGRRELSRTIRTAGAVMHGGWSATALGDFTAGPSHELPTGRAGRFSSGLQVVDFMRRSSLVEYGRKSLERAAGVVEAFAEMEDLDAHGRSVGKRRESHE